MQDLTYLPTTSPFSFFTKAFKHLVAGKYRTRVTQRVLTCQQLVIEHWGRQRRNIYTFSPKKYPENDSLPKLHIANQDVPYTTTIKYLGVYLDFELSFKEHISKIYEKVNKYVGIFYHAQPKFLARHKLPP